MDSSVEFIDMVLSGASPEQTTDKIKELLYAKSSGMIDELKPAIAQSMFTQEEE